MKKQTIVTADKAANARMTIRLIKCIYICAVYATLSATPALAAENGAQHYPIGVNTVANGYLPLPGMLQYLNYAQMFQASSFAGNTGQSSVPGFHLTAFVNASRFLYTWTPQIGPFHYTTGLVLPVISLSLNAFGEHGQDFNLGDIDLQNYLGYVSPDHKLFFYFGLDTYMPTGSYNKNKLINAANNYYTFGPNINASYNVSPKLVLDASLFTEFNTANGATHYHSGDDADVDYSLTYRPFSSLPKLGLGIQGYFYEQVTDDTVNGTNVAPNGFKGQEFGIGPQIRYDIPFGGFVVKYQHAYAVRNRPAGDRVWFEFAFPLFGAPHAS